MGKLTAEQKANLSQEVIAKAMQCETAAELVELAKSEGIELTTEKAQAYLDEMNDFELDRQQLKQVAGGEEWDDCTCYAKDKSPKSGGASS
ncbi:MAG: hypothetical protein IJK81_11220 [Selenomonadaceae bacterium]|nr:hypothetical protein [Selenomonadaceae bacterium]